MLIVKDLIAVVIGLLLTAITFGSFYTVSVPAPDHAIVYADTDKKVYYAPPYVDYLKEHPEIIPEQPVNIKNLQAVTMDKAKGLGYSADPVSKNKGFFVHKYRSFTGLMMEKIGLYKPLPSRWNTDGTWNW